VQSCGVGDSRRNERLKQCESRSSVACALSVLAMRLGPSSSEIRTSRTAAVWYLTQSSASVRFLHNKRPVSHAFLLNMCRKLPSDVAAPRRSEVCANSQWIHVCVQRINVSEGNPLQPSPELSRTLNASSVVVFGAIPRNQDRFFWSPLLFKVDVARMDSYRKPASEPRSMRDRF